MPVVINGTTGISGVDGSAGTPAFQGSDTNTGIRFGTDIVSLVTGGSDRLYIDSSGKLGVGTSSPAQSWTGGASQVLQLQGPAATITVLRINESGGTYGDLQLVSSGSAEVGVYNFSNGAMRFGTNGTERLRIDSSGRVGIGSTSPDVNLVVEAATGDATLRVHAAENNSGSEPILILESSNDFAESIIEFKDSSGTGGAIRYNHGDNAIRFQTNGSSERARIDSSGRLLVGTSSSSANVSAVFRDNSAQNGPAQILLATSSATPTSAEALARIHFSANNQSFAATIEGSRDGGTWTAGSSQPSKLTFSTCPDGSASPVERLRITNNGYVRASVDGIPYLSNTSSWHEFTGNAGEYVFRIRQKSSSNPFGLNIEYSDATPNNTDNRFLNCTDATAHRFRVRSNGGVENYQANNSNLCDEREKKNIEDLDSTWDCLKHWELKKFHYNEDSNAEAKRYGVIAQQVAPLCPEVITEWVKQDAADAVVDDDGNEITPAKEKIVRLGVKEQQMYWMAIKAIQEAQVRIETLEAEVAALKAQ